MAVDENRTDDSLKNDSAAVDHQSRSMIILNDQNTVQHKQIINGNGVMGQHHKMNGVDLRRNGDEDDGGEGFKREMRDLEEMLSKLNPMAEERGMAMVLVGEGMNVRTSMAQREEVIRRTVHVSDIDHQVTEEQLATLFLTCGQVVDCRICGDPYSVLRCAFIEFTDEKGARNALSLAGTMLGFYPVKVLPSKTAIAPVNPTFLPRSEDEREMCARSIYCTNIDKKAESAIAALNCSGAILGSLPIRVSPSKTPVRPRTPRSAVQ
ncbi:hypothetical protein K7X08_035353 [Anisodus acutangulus]|uniref:RRM domain-containing protein n=1 Tax=Anisodus acutangulus TaxID=402998 RepID=A0A9Q1LJZ3_9SOLA|nr:hypothetical protein K7X08_035353 [Anisodus acutangulus]